MAVVSVALAIASAALWGGADYLAGVSSRRMAVLAVTFISQLAGLLTVGLLLLATGEPLSAAGALWGVGAGLVGAATLGVFYAALAGGAMSLVAPLSACGAVVPVGIALARGGAPGALTVAGIAVALAGIVLIARRDDEALALTPRVLGLAAAAALGIGTVLALLQLGAGAEGSSGIGVVVAARASAVSLTGLALLATRTRLAASRGALAPIAAVGVADTGANALFAVASEGGADALVAMLASLYPVTTVLLARALLAERLTLRQGAGVALALAGAALVSTG
jgi:drug/metabolite transporter (DMT)-like permease